MAAQKLEQFDDVIVFTAINVTPLADGGYEVDYGGAVRGFIQVLKPSDRYRRAEIAVFRHRATDVNTIRGAYSMELVKELIASGNDEWASKGVYCSLREGKKLLADKERAEAAKAQEREKRREAEEQDRINYGNIQAMVIQGKEHADIVKATGLNEDYVADKIKQIRTREGGMGRRPQMAR